MDFAFPLNVDILWTVNHDFSDGIVIQQRLQRTETQYFSRDLLEQTSTLRAGKNNVFLGEDLLEQVLDRTPHIVGSGHIHGWIQLREELVLYSGFKIEIRTSLWRGCRER